MERLAQIPFNRRTAWLAVFFVWVLIYLPSLGRLEVQSNEPKRMMPAEHMLESGDWITPELYGEKYYKKPPLINWMIAASYRVCGINEGAARLPSILMVLAAATVLLLLPAPWLDLSGRFAAALVYMTTYTVVESGRLAEIESSLIALTAMSVFWWLAYAWTERPAPWRQWLGAGLLLGFGMLLKGPPILLYFYLPVIAATVYTRRWKMFFHPAHGAALLLMLAIFFAWAWPNLQAAPVQTKVSGTWEAELMQQMALKNIKWGNWIKQTLFGLVGFLPWLALLPLLKYSSENEADSGRRLALKTCLFALIAGFILVNLMPGTRGRYSAPLAVYPALATALLLGRVGLTDRLNRHKQAVGTVLMTAFLVLTVLAAIAAVAVYGGLLPRLLSSLGVRPSMPLHPAAPFWTALLLALGITGVKIARRMRTTPTGTAGFAMTGALLIAAVTMIYSVIAIPVVGMFDIKRPPAAELNRAAVDPLPIIVYGIDEPFCFYLRRPLKFLNNPALLPDADQYIMTDPRRVQDLKSVLARQHRQLTPIGSTTYKKDTYLLLRSGPSAPTATAK